MPGMGKVTVTYLARDMLECSGGKWQITFEAQTGDLEAMTVMASTLAGTGVTISTKEV